jgi:hypothetical protein
MEMMMRTLKTEEMELVAGAAQPDESTFHKNNGLGNYNQGAPGGSGPHNGAENNAGGNSSGNPPGSGNFPVIPN